MLTSPRLEGPSQRCRRGEVEQFALGEGGPMWIGVSLLRTVPVLIPPSRGLPIRRGARRGGRLPLAGVPVPVELPGV
jgi:hypothetical protein